MPEAQGTRPPVGPVGASQLTQVATPMEYRPQATSTLASARTLHQLLKLQRFDGSGGLDTFLVKFQHLVSNLNWNEEDAVHHLCGSLEGATGQVICG